MALTNICSLNTSANTCNRCNSLKGDQTNAFQVWFEQPQQGKWDFNKACFEVQLIPFPLQWRGAGSLLMLGVKEQVVPPYPKSFICVSEHLYFS